MGKNRNGHMNGTPVLPTPEERPAPKTSAEIQREYRKRKKVARLYPNLSRRFKIRANLRRKPPVSDEERRAKRRAQYADRKAMKKSLSSIPKSVVVRNPVAVQDPHNPKVSRVTRNGSSLPSDSPSKPRISDVARYDGVDRLEKLAKLSLTDREIADVLGVTENQLKAWRRRHPAVGNAIKRGRHIADSNVVESLYRMAIGYTVPDEVVKVNGDGKVTIVETTKFYPPNPVAAFFWLKNRQSEHWRDKREVEQTGASGIVAKEVKFVVVAPGKGEQPEKVLDGDYKVLEGPKKSNGTTG